MAGFFEDLPVLLFVLAGTFTIVISSLSVSVAVVSTEESAKLDFTANRCVELLLSELLGQSDGNQAMVGSFCSTRLFQVAEEFLGKESYCVGIMMIHPELRWLLATDLDGTTVPERASSSSRLFNALTDDGLSAILVVRLIVW